MSESTAFDPNVYLIAPELNAGTAITLVDGLTLTQPKPAPPLAKKILKKLQLLKQRIASELAHRKVPSPLSANPQDVDMAADKAWRAVRHGLDAYLDLQPSYAPLRESALALSDILFGDGGLAFTALPYKEQRNEMKFRLAALDHGEQVEKLRKIVGDAYVDNLFDAVRSYDSMVLSMLEGAGSIEEKLAPLLRETQKLIVDYARYIAATVDEDDPETIDAARKVLAPIDNLRKHAQLALKPRVNACAASRVFTRSVSFVKPSRVLNA